MNHAVLSSFRYQRSMSPSRVARHRDGSHDSSNDLLWSLSDVSPGEAEDTPASCDRLLIPTPVRFEAIALAVPAIRIPLDRQTKGRESVVKAPVWRPRQREFTLKGWDLICCSCLLYTSDAADEYLRV